MIGGFAILLLSLRMERFRIHSESRNAAISQQYGDRHDLPQMRDDDKFKIEVLQSPLIITLY